MELHTPFVTAIGIFDVSDFLPYLRNLFVEDAENIKQIPNENGFKTSLKGYAYGDTTNINYLHNSKEGDGLRVAIESAAKEYAAVCGYASDAYIAEISNSWLNEMPAGSAHEFHSHQGKTFSGCIYVDMPPNTPGIGFLSPRTRFDYMAMNIAQYTTFNSLKWGFEPKEGQLYIWESWLLHGVNSGNFEGTRRSAAFDVVMKLI
jgi:uncharacterized protein (TIGR02466 family)